MSAPDLPDPAIAPLAEGETAYHLAGPEDGPRVVLVHGFALPAYNYEPLVRRMSAAGLRTLRYDLYGRGRSARLAGRRHDWRVYVRQLGALLAHVGWDGPLPLVGHSMGGHIVASFALAHPARVGRLALIAPMTQPPRWRLIWPLWLPLVGRTYVGKRYLPRMRDAQTSAQRRARFAAQMDRGFNWAILSTIRNFPRWPGRRVYLELARREATPPMLLLWSRDDADTPYALAEPLTADLQAAGADATLVSFDGLGHSPHVADVDQAAPPLIDFVRGD